MMGGLMASSIIEAGTCDTSDWYNADGTLHYPPNGGAVRGTERTITLKRGFKVGRYGKISPNSDYVTKARTPWQKLSLPPYTNIKKHYVYEVKKDITGVIKSKVAPWGDSRGGGWQYKLPSTIQYLIDNGYLERVVK